MQPHRFTVDFSRSIGDVKLFNSVNKAPLRNLQRLPRSFAELEVPLVRLHDSPFDTQAVVDINYLFPMFDRDPDDPGSYAFRKTDDYIKAIQDSGSRVYFRLGTSIEHSPNKYFTHAPADLGKWARVCLNVVNHYRKGWANGFEWPIDYWEIWNEPDNGPSMWVGTAQQYYEMYTLTAKAIKQSHPDVKIGGPAICTPHNRAYLDPFFTYIKQQGAPLDFFSWHIYTNDPAGMARDAYVAEKLLSEHGLTSAENHCNEWNFLPGGEYWRLLNDPDTQEEARRMFERLNGAEGAAFDAAAIILAQDSPLNLAMFYTGDSTRFGFYKDGVPQKNYYVFLAMKHFKTASRRVHIEGNDEKRGLALLAGLAPSGGEAVLLLSNFTHAAQGAAVQLAALPWDGPTGIEVFRLDAQHSLERVRQQSLPAVTEVILPEINSPCVCMVKLHKA